MKKIIIILIFVMLAFSCGKSKNADIYPKKIKKGSPEYIMNKGLFYLNEGKLPLAEKELNRALKKKPDLIQAINALGIISIYKRDFKKAITHFEKVLQLNPAYHDANNFLGLVHTELNNYDKAKENLLIAANSTKYRNPENAFNNLAKLEYRNRKYKSALRYVDKGLELNQNFAPLLNMKGLILENMNDFKEAIIYFSKALKVLTVEDASYLINIGRVYGKTGEKNKALDVLERALSLTTSNQMRQLIRDMIKELEK